MVMLLSKICAHFFNINIKHLNRSRNAPTEEEDASLGMEGGLSGRVATLAFRRAVVYMVDDRPEVRSKAKTEAELFLRVAPGHVLRAGLQNGLATLLHVVLNAPVEEMTPVQAAETQYDLQRGLNLRVGKSENTLKSKEKVTKIKQLKVTSALKKPCYR